MIIIKIKGGLGNQMFQYAIAKAFSLETKRPFQLDISIFEWYKLHNYGLHHFNIQPEFYKPESKWKMKLKKIFNKVVFYNEDHHSFNYNPNLHLENEEKMKKITVDPRVHMWNHFLRGRFNISSSQVHMWT